MADRVPIWQDIRIESDVHIGGECGKTRIQANFVHRVYFSRGVNTFTLFSDPLRDDMTSLRIEEKIASLAPSLAMASLMPLRCRNWTGLCLRRFYSCYR